MTIHRDSQEHRILMLLAASYPDWTPAPALARVSLQYSARIHSLRRKGWQIANRVEIASDGKRHGSFRLASPMTWPNPKNKKRASETARIPSADVDQSSSSPAPAAEQFALPLIGEVRTGEHRDDG